MPEQTPPGHQALKARVTERITRAPGPLLRARARRFGLNALTGKPQAIELYYEPGDPHSHLAAQCMETLQASTPVPVVVRLVSAPDAVLYPEEPRQRQFALLDCQRIAPAYGLQFPDHAQAATPELRRLAARILVHAKQQNRFEAVEPRVAVAVFAGDRMALDAMATSDGCAAEEETAAVLDANHRRRSALGHYLPGMWTYDGDWFWGIDRLGYLKSRLAGAHAWTGEEQPWPRDPGKANLPALPDPLPPLEFFFSFRSPYSYVAAIQLRQEIDRLGLALQVRPVLPMAMRGMKIPPSKRLYIPRDTRREAERLGIPFGRIADPIGAGAERCLNTFRLAEGAAQQLDFCCEAGTAIWSEAVDVATDEGLEYVCNKAGISWDRALDSLGTGIDLSYAEENRQALFDCGYWGVPCYRIGEFSTWGRDRFWMVRELVRRAADSRS